MTVFFCINCKTNFKRKSHLIQHFNRKNLCTNLTSYEINKNNKSNIVGKNRKKLLIPQNSAQNTQNSAQNTQKFTEPLICTINMIPIDTIPINMILNDMKPNDMMSNDMMPNDMIPTDMIPTDMIPNDMIPTNIISNNKLECKYCNKIFSRKDILKRHVFSSCKIKKLQDEEKEIIFKKLLEQEYVIKKKDEQINKLLNQNDVLINKINVLEEKVEKISKFGKKNNKQIISISSKLTNSNNSNNIINTTNTTNTTNTINTINTNTNTNTNTNSNNVVFNLVNYGKEDLDKIDIKYFLNNVVKNTKALGVKIPEEILKVIHFNPDYPEHNNIYISDINREKCMVYEDNQWKLSSEDKIPEVIDKVVKYSYDKQEKLKEQYQNNKSLTDRLNVINKYTQFIDNVYLDDLKDFHDVEYKDNIANIKRCEDFQKKTYNTFKTTMYNEGIKIKKNKPKYL